MKVHGGSETCGSVAEVLANVDGVSAGGGGWSLRPPKAVTGGGWGVGPDWVWIAPGRRLCEMALQTAVARASAIVDADF